MPPEAASPELARANAGSAERFFQWSLYLLLVTGFVALMGTNRLDVPSLVLVVPALLLRGYFLLLRKDFILPERWTSYLTILYFAFYLADYFYFSQSFIGATVHMVLFSLVVKIFSVRRDRDLVYLIVLSFLMVLAAAVLTVDTIFLAAFSVFIVVAMGVFISMEMRRSERGAVLAGPMLQHGTTFYRSLAGVAALLGTLTMAGAALIFFVLPRINTGGYLRNLGVESAMLTGFSREVRLGGIGQIQQSNAVVMHVQVLHGKLPDDPKWRGIALANFDGQVWWNRGDGSSLRGFNSSSLELAQAVPFAFYSEAAPIPRASTFTYRVVMEPLGLNLFFLAPVPLRLSGNYQTAVIAPDGSVSEMPGVGVYTAEADARNPEPLVRNSNAGVRDYPPRVSMYLQLPSTLDHRVRDLARNVTASSPTNYARARDIERYLRSNYGYTLELPGNSQPDPLAYFLFQRKKGHCEYFASSMAIMLRTLNVPARVVNGFRGGEYNDVTGNYIVREKDAHSWVEVYFPEFGWVTFDPTPAAASPAPAGGWARLALYMDAVSGMWREWVVNYDFSHQVRLSNQIGATTGSMHSSFRTWLAVKYRGLLDRVNGWQQRMERMSPAEMTVSCLLLALLLALPFVPKAWRTLQWARTRRNPQRAPTSAASFWYLRMLKRLARRGIRKSPAQTPEEFTSSIADPQMRSDVAVFTEHYERARFAGSVEDAELLPELFEEMAERK